MKRDEMITQLHSKAMEYASAAYMADIIGDSTSALKHRHSAFELERDAALMLLTRTKTEPTRSVLFRSAATLALACHQIRDAEKLVAMGLSGDPPDEIAEELRDVLEQVYFDRHMAVRGVVLESNHLQMSLVGNGVGLGAANIEDILPRAQAVEKAYHRLIERKRQKTFNSSIDRAIQRKNPVNMTIPRAASFAVSFQVGRQLDLPIPIAGDTSDLLKEMVECFALYEQGNEKGLHEIINDGAYYNNFVGLVRLIAPDGHNVSMVGFTLSHRGTTRTVSLTKRASTIGFVPVASNANSRPRNVVENVYAHKSVRGMLLFANSESETNKIHVVDPRNRRNKKVVIVPTGMMDDIVRPMWGRLVNVDCIVTKEGLMLDDIHLDEEQATKTAGDE